ncbi:DinB family protein [Paenibacillus radicis (ex Xue et al. 2023)]|uniref:DinB family protein n=1 Tax=Paenibacillus radicis (ex Xue et al. 2023) TaxID=2972489 RepID=A0ABT1YIC7_9BACL|nr:DinB family protein [Paenibacillus radicis (ex Xue et al. 2023)]MCR8632023.1 DinB family protein [Paenibacillus radicis (ex Xue et al. 2023)]
MSNKAALNYGQTAEEILKYKEFDEQRLHEPISEGKWSVKEIIGHLYYWDKFILEKHVPFMNDGTNLNAFPNHDLHNREAIEYISFFTTTGSLIEEFVLNRRLLIETISGIDSNVKFTIGYGKRQSTVDNYLKIFIDHDIHHLKQMNERLS